MEEERKKWIGLYESDELNANDCERIRCILHQILEEGRVALAKDIDIDKGDTFKYELLFEGGIIMSIYYGYSVDERFD